MRIDIRLDPARLRRWQLHIVEELARDPSIEVQVSQGKGVDWPAGVSALFWLERTLYRSGVDDPLAAENWSSIARFPTTDAPVLQFDLAGDGPGDLPTVRLFADGQPVEIGALAAVLDNQGTELSLRRVDGGQDSVLARAWPAIEDPYNAGVSLGFILGRAAELAIGVVRTSAATCSIPSPSGEGEAKAAAALPAPRPSPGTFLFRSLTAKIERRLREQLGQRSNWFVATGPATLSGLPDLARTGFSRLADDGARFYADPFVWHQDGQHFLFVEEFPYATGRGLISVAEMDAAGRPGKMRPALETQCHLSYPFLFAFDDAIWMIPETSKRATVELYRADPFPDRWTLHTVLLDNVDLGDVTLQRAGDVWWMFAGSRARWTSSWDALSLYRAMSPFGPWEPHPRNPVLVDRRSARPAGRIFERDGRLIRPVQDSSRGYGSALGFAAIEQLDEAGFRQHIVGRAEPWPGANGLHTFNQAGHFAAIDVFGPRR